MSIRILTLTFALLLVMVGLLRLSAYAPSILSAYAEYATFLYIAGTIFFAVALGRPGVSMQRVGFFRPPELRDIGLAVLGVLILQASGAWLGPVWGELFGAGRDLGRFDTVSGDLGVLLSVLLLSWTVAAFGEEITFRVVLMRGIAASLGKGRVAMLLALVLQAVVFGFVHIYQGPAGVASSTISGLVFGALVLAPRGAIWPAALAHGFNNTIGLLALYHAP
ncbi:CPBP family intramembrane glutamic endopeptidase [Parvularcula sp. IMCC14364]|uniref:CPBP family intramembrane glutamic endopeptidase n=1 Tax=Parvularcula sp. IMCC14364 TaxID=3067902 RepID=UPI002741761F|nr:CPBP family intramembrane glutamic endopeptidase [Parvularcula sp. IMCC14364]